MFIRKDFAPVDIASLPPLNGTADCLMAHILTVLWHTLDCRMAHIRQSRPDYTHLTVLWHTLDCHTAHIRQSIPEAIDVFIRKDFAPVDIASLPPLNGTFFSRLYYSEA